MTACSCCGSPLTLEGKCATLAETACTSTDEGRQPQLLGSGATDFQQCGDCAWDICWQAAACLKKQVKT
jgi:hypothetical protein